LAQPNGGRKFNHLSFLKCSYLNTHKRGLPPCHLATALPHSKLAQSYGEKAEFPRPACSSIGKLEVKKNKGLNKQTLLPFVLLSQWKNLLCADEEVLILGL
jgi:hypothetical protein